MISKSFFIKILFAPLLIFILTACFEIKEEVYVKKNGSGTYSLTIDLSEIAQLFLIGETFQKAVIPDSLREGISLSNPLEKMKFKFDSLESKLSSIEGISNYETIFDTANFIIGAKYNFANMAALNKAMNTMQEKKSDNKKEPIHYAYSNKTFERFNSIYVSDIGKMKENEADTLITSLLSELKYTVIYKFDKKVSEYDNENYFLSGNRKTLMHTAPLIDVMRGKYTIENKVRF